VYRCSVIARGGLVLAIFSKTLRLKENPETESRAMTLMVSDAQRISAGFAFVHELWAAVIEAAIFTYLLQDSMGLTSLCVLGLAIFCMLASSAISRVTSQQQQVWLQAVQKRLAATQKMLSTLKAIKMIGMEKRVSLMVSGLRVDEMAAAKLFRSLLALSAMLSYATLTLSPLLVFGAYLGATGLEGAVDATQMFTSLVLITLLASPLIHLFQALPSLGAAYGCFHRLGEFLNLEEQGRQSVSSVKVKSRRSGPSKAESENEEALISVIDGSFGYVSDKEPILKGINLTIKKGKRVAILGAVGAGKSLVLRALLGEAHCFSSGEQPIAMRTDSVAYCSQKPWLENKSAEANWLETLRHPQSATSEACRKWMERVAHACALGDILALPDYRTGTVGSGGSRLSGGQRQRLVSLSLLCLLVTPITALLLTKNTYEKALARALALKKDVLLLDDTFSALDPATKTRVANRLLNSKDGLAPSRQMTVVFTTNDRDLIRLADEAYEIDSEGHIIPIDASALPAEGIADEPDNNIQAIHDRRSPFDIVYNKSDEEKDSSSSSSVSTGTESRNGTDKTSIDGEVVSDREVYKTYAKSMGMKHAFVFLLAGIIFAVTLKLPGMWTPPLPAILRIFLSL